MHSKVEILAEAGEPRSERTDTQNQNSPDNLIIFLNKLIYYLFSDTMCLPFILSS